MKSKILVVASMLLSTFVFNSCKKEGPAGKDGVDGNANVTATTLNVTSWTWDPTNYWRYAVFTGVGALTSTVNNGGAVMLYQSDGAGEWIPLPFTLNVTSTIQLHHWFTYGTSTVTVYSELSDLSDPNPAPASFKLVCIPPAGMILHPNVDLRNYKQVERLFHVK